MIFRDMDQSTSEALLTDLYQLTMMQGYHSLLRSERRATFDVFYRSNPYHGGFAIASGLQRVIDYLANLRFDNSDIEYLKSLGMFTDELLAALRTFRFTGDVWAVPEGTVVFPNEPLLRVEARVFEAQLIETAVLNKVGFATLIATKANRVVRAAQGRPVLEFGLRRAQEADAGVWGARSAIIGGCAATSNVLAGKKFGLKVAGTHAHSWVMDADSELEAFRDYARVYPDNLTLLVDTYDVLKSGIQNAIKVFKEVHEWHGKPKSFGIRLDSGDLAYLSKQARKMLDKAGFPDAKITVSNDLDEYKIQDLLQQGASIDSFGVGTYLITGGGQSSLGDVYKLSEKEVNEARIPTLKRSENPEKITNPGRKRVLRFVRDGEAVLDLICLADEAVPQQPFECFDPVYTFKRKTVEGAEVEELLVPVFKDGWLGYEPPTIPEIQANLQHSLAQFPDEVKRFSNPHEYHVDLSQSLYDTKMRLLAEAKVGAASK